MSRHLRKNTSVLTSLDTTANNDIAYIDCNRSHAHNHIMGKKKRMPNATAHLKADQKKGSREGTVGKQFYIDEELAAAFDDFMESFGELPPTQTSVFEAALRMFLASKGHWPRRNQEKT